MTGAQMPLRHVDLAIGHHHRRGGDVPSARIVVVVLRLTPPIHGITAETGYSARPNRKSDAVDNRRVAEKGRLRETTRETSLADG